MTTVLIIAEDPALRSAWVEAAAFAGHTVRAASCLLDGVDLLGTVEIDGLLVDARADGELEMIAAVSAYRPMPPTVLVHDRDISLPARIRAAACRHTDASPTHLVTLLGRLLAVRELARPTNLPVRMTPAALKWTTRLSGGAGEDESDESRGFDGETSPDGFDIAAS